MGDFEGIFANKVCPAFKKLVADPPRMGGLRNRGVERKSMRGGQWFQVLRGEIEAPRKT